MIGNSGDIPEIPGLLLNPATGNFEIPVDNVEYICQKYCRYETVYCQYFTTSLPASLTSGNNVSALVDYMLQFNNGVNRHITRGAFKDKDTVDQAAGIKLLGLTEKNNLELITLNLTVTAGWVEYTK